MNNSVCLLYGKGGNYEIGFFVNMQVKDKKIPCLITKYNIMENYYEKIINIFFNNKNEILELGDIKYKNIEYDLSIIEILENKNLNIKLIEINENLFGKELDNYYYKESIYIIHNNKNEFSVSYGVIDGIIESDMKYIFNINSNSKVCPIFNLSNNKIIGIHENNLNNKNKGIVLTNIIRQCNNKNEIDLKVNIDKYDIKRNIYFLDNYDNSHNNLNELNESNTKLYINKIEYKFQKYFIPDHEGEYNIKLKFNTNITDCSYMFAGCRNIININLISFNTKSVKNMKYMFYECKIKNINLFSFYTKNIKCMDHMFGLCKNLKKLDLSSFEIKNIKSIIGLFYKCPSLVNLTGLSQWNTNQVIDMSYLFCDCSSLNSLPDISKWNTNKVNNISYLFCGCSSLNSLPDISKWNMNNVNNISYLFCGCSSLNSLPDICQLKANKNSYISYSLCNYWFLKSLPDSKKDIKLTFIGESGVGCKQLSKVATRQSFSHDDPACATWRYNRLNFGCCEVEINVDIWNGPGQEKYQSFCKIMSKNSDIIIFVYSIDFKYSFDCLPDKINMIKESNLKQFMGAIVGNKKDLELEVGEDKGRELAKKYNYKFYLASAFRDPEGFRKFLEELIFQFLTSNYRN